jgi:predicted ferric reductase
MTPDLAEPGSRSARRRAPRRVRVRPAPRWWRDAVGVAAWSSGLVVVSLWLAGSGVQTLVSSPADALMSLGRIVGLVAADLLLLQVVLMARVPWIERSYGQDELVRRHRLVGFWSFNLLVLHVVLITLGYTLGDHTDVLRESWTLLTSYAGMLLAAAGTVALTVVTVTSVRIARRALRYESWHLLHLYAYVGVALSVPHEIWTGKDFSTSQLARGYWWGVYLLALAAVLVFRVGVPAWRTVRHGITVTSVRRESPDVVTVHMGGRGLHRLPVQAGQFFVWRFLDGPGWSRGNPYSLSAAPRVDHVQITAKDLGDGSARLAGLRPGTRVLIEGPYGRLTGEHLAGDRLAMLACGIGITPMRALLEDLDYLPGDAVLVYRARSKPDLIFRTELDELAAQRGITIHYLTGPRIPGRASWLPKRFADYRDSDALLRLIPDLSRRDVFVCGPDAWMAAAAAASREAGLPEDQLHLERFTW